MVSTTGIRCGNYTILETLGEGTYGVAKKAECLTTGRLVALKILKSDKLSKDFQKEIKILAKLNHKHLTNLIEVLFDVTYTEENGVEVIRNVIVMELASRGHFFAVLKASAKINKAGLSEAVTRTFFQQMVEAVEYCHGKGIVHRDIKPENVLLDEDYNLKLADFGWATLIDGKKHITEAGTQVYQAPEILKMKGYELEPVDIFTLGIMLFMMRAAGRPFKQAAATDSWYRYFFAGKPEEFWKIHTKSKSEGFFSEDFKKLVEGMLEADPKNRWKIKEIKASKWYQDEAAEKTVIIEEFAKLQESIRQIYQEEDEDRRKAREAAAQKAQIVNRGMFQGFKAYRGNEDVVSAIESGLGDLATDIENEERAIKIKPENQKNECTFEFYVELKFLFKCLVFVAKAHALEWEASKTAYQIRGVFATEEDAPDTVEIIINVYQLEFEGEYAVEFVKLQGDYWDFLNLVYDDIVPKITNLTK